MRGVFSAESGRALRTMSAKRAVRVLAAYLGIGDSSIHE
jgi:hypothetical protein